MWGVLDDERRQGVLVVGGDDVVGGDETNCPSNVAIRKFGLHFLRELLLLLLEGWGRTWHSWGRCSGLPVRLPPMGNVFDPFGQINNFVSLPGDLEDVVGKKE